MKIILLLVSTVLWSLSDGYNILCVFTIPTRSHNIMGAAIVRSLLKAGHEVTWATPYPDDVKSTRNLTVIDVSEVQPLFKDLEIDVRRVQDLDEVRITSRKITAVTFKNPELRRAMIEKSFDAVVSEWLFTDTHAGMAAALQVPWILFNTVPMHPYMEYLVDEIRSVPILPSIIPFPVPMSFFQRLVSSLIIVAIQHGIWKHGQSTAAFYESTFKPIATARGVTLPTLREALHNVSILFVNSHPSFSLAQSLPPNVIEIGGFHIEEDIPALPKDLQDILDSSPQGVVYFSLGSVVSSAALSQQTKKNLVKILRELPYTVLWKFDEQLNGLPKHVHVRPWMPQLSILSHPNVKLFITHGGLLSTLEALHFGVPLLTIPVFGDQPFNAARAVSDGYAVQVPYAEDMEEDLKAALKEILGNDSYHQKARYLSKLFHNRPLPPSKLISHYVELAIETKGALHLRSKALLYTWYQRWMLDQIIFLMAVLYLLYRIMKKLVLLVVEKLVEKTENDHQKIKKS